MYAPDEIIGVVCSGKAKKAKGASKSALLVATDKGVAVANLEAVGEGLEEDDTRPYHVNSASSVRSGPRFSLRRISRSRMTERGLHEVPFS